ncbi:hypothetical protein IWX76_000114 [Pedobacter sp. CAN_A7]
MTGLKKEQQTAKLSSETELDLKVSNNLQENRLLLNLVNRKDSTVTNAQLEIWPKGRFSFSPEHGFVGEAERLKWHGQETSAATQQQQFTLTSALEKVEVLDVDLKQQQKVQAQVKTSRSSWQGWLLLLLLVVPGLYIALRHWRKY